MKATQREKVEPLKPWEKWDSHRRLLYDQEVKAALQHNPDTKGTAARSGQAKCKYHENQSTKKRARRD
jgi:hypothetical protein